MSTKKNTDIEKRSKNTPEKFGRGKAVVQSSSDKDQQHKREMSKLAISPSAAATLASAPYLKPVGDLDVVALMDNLGEWMKRVHEGDLKEVESMLIGQAFALQSIFMHLASRSSRVTELKQYELDLRLALKAQSQCRATLETLATIKNPPIVLARQANVTTGPQQINNGALAPPSPACGELKTERNELLENNHVERMDTGTKSKACQGHTPVEAVGAVHGSANR